MPPGALTIMSPSRHDAAQHPAHATTVNAHNADALYEVTKQLYSRLKKLRGKYRDLERKHILLKSIYARVKHDEMMLRTQTPNQVGAGREDGTRTDQDMKHPTQTLSFY